VGVLFHLAVQQDWERASRLRGYTTASLREDGFIHCVMATQHARVANDLYRAGPTWCCC